MNAYSAHTYNPELHSPQNNHLRSPLQVGSKDCTCEQNQWAQTVNTLVTSLVESNRIILRSNEIIADLAGKVIQNETERRHQLLQPVTASSIISPTKSEPHGERWTHLSKRIAELQNTMQSMLDSYKGMEDDKKVIAVDVDEVLAVFMEKLVLFYNFKFPEKHLTFDRYTTYHIWEVWGLTPQEGMKIIEEFFTTDLFKNHVPIDGSQEVLRRLSKEYELIVVTSRHATLEPLTKKFLDTCYPGIFSRALFGNHFGAGKKISKPDMCKEVNALLLIDDQFDYANQCAEQGMKAILFGEYPWNNKAKLHDNMRRARNWYEVEDLIDMLLDGTD